jgi:hypothetical protein
MKTHISRAWAMPSPWTFSIQPIEALLTKWIKPDDKVVDPFCGQSKWATHGNDLAQTGMTANQWLDSLIEVEGEGWADAVLLDPPYSPRQISECYKSVGLPVSTNETQNARLYRDAIIRLDRVLKPGGIAMRFGWSSAGFGKTKGYQMLEILMVAHGGAHNDTICTVEAKPESIFATEAAL